MDHYILAAKRNFKESHICFFLLFSSCTTNKRISKAKWNSDTNADVGTDLNVCVGSCPSRPSPLDPHPVGSAKRLLRDIVDAQVSKYKVCWLLACRSSSAHGYIHVSSTTTLQQGVLPLGCSVDEDTRHHSPRFATSNFKYKQAVHRHCDARSTTDKRQHVNERTCKAPIESSMHGCLVSFVCVCVRTPHNLFLVKHPTVLQCT